MPEKTQYSPVPLLRQIMHKWQQRMQFNGIPSIRRRQKNMLAGNAHALQKKTLLLLQTSHMFNNGIGENKIKRVILKWHAAPVAQYKLKTYICFFKPSGILIG